MIENKRDPDKVKKWAMEREQDLEQERVKQRKEIEAEEYATREYAAHSSEHRLNDKWAFLAGWDRHAELVGPLVEALEEFDKLAGGNICYGCDTDDRAIKLMHRAKEALKTYRKEMGE